MHNNKTYIARYPNSSTQPELSHKPESHQIKQNQ